ncbi:MAG: NAD(P)-dependent oxidoreductase [Termitinemataceae bacterium]|nr:MAG: NAD(P)-dependent oxidoreductase [Termitinemataceae bacterium]
MEKTVLLTGSKGLIGSEALKPLLDAGFKVFTLSSATTNLMNTVDVRKLFDKLKPQYLLHFAWITNAGYLESDVNYELRDASFSMLKTFKENGGKKAVFAGTCFEYDFHDERIKETDKLNPTTVYAKCKNELHLMCEEYAAANDLSFGWGRIFYVTGHNEHANRLLPTIINNLKNNQKVLITAGPLVRDYMYTKDIAAGFVRFLDSDVSGCVNICKGSGISIKDYALSVAKKTGNFQMLEFADNIENQPKSIVGDNSRMINEVKYKPQYSIESALEEIIK